MAELSSIVAMLHAQRRELVEQLAAVDRAIAALDIPAMATSDQSPVALSVPPDPSVAPALPVAALPVLAAPLASPALPESSVVAPTRLKARRLQSDEHKHAVGAGRRKARAARDAASGIARDMQGDDFVSAVGYRGGRQPPRLVKRSPKP